MLIVKWFPAEQTFLHSSLHKKKNKKKKKLMKEISAKEKSLLRFHGEMKLENFIRCTESLWKWKDLARALCNFPSNKFSPLRKTMLLQVLVKGGKIIWLLLYERINFNAMALKFSFQFEIEMEKKETNFAILTRSQKATTERITQNGVGEEKSLIWWAFKYHYDFSSYNYYHPNNRSSCSRGSLKFHCIPLD